MKKLLTCVAMALLLAGCATEFDDSGIKARLDTIEAKLIQLESNIQSLQSAVGNGVFVAKVQEYVDPETGKTIGVTVTYTNGDVKYFEITPKADYAGPVLGVITNGAGDLVWAIDGIAILVEGKEVPVYQTPVFTIDEDGNLLVSIDGSDPVVLGQVQNEGATLVDGIFTDIKVEQDKIVLTLSDGSKVNIPFAEAFKLNIETTEYTFSTLAAIEIPYTVTAKTANTVVGVAGYSPREFTVEVAADKIIVTPLSLKAAGVLLVYADSKVGLTSIVNVTVEGEGMEVVDTPFNAEVDYMAEGEGGSVEAHIVSNIEPEVKPVENWIHVVSVKSKAYVITLSLDDNTTGEVRTGTVNIFKKGTETLVQTITIAQAKVVVGPADLSKKESANSYLVYAAGEYRFKAVKGNSTESVGAVAKAEVLWETLNSETAPAAGDIIASVDSDGEYIIFSTPATLKPGNAVIAAKDANDVILWSWHIWIPETEITTGTYGFSSTTAMMDRNLGALHAAEAGSVDAAACGMYYQWGRKDPFMPLGSFTAKTVAATAPADAWTKEATQLTIQQAIEQPTVFAYGSNDWTTEPDDNLWQENKTQYDPCPPGYRVAAYGNPKLFDYVTAANYDAWAWNEDCVTAGTTEAGTTILPYNGLVYYSSGNYDAVAGRVRLWTCTQKGEGAARALDLKYADMSTSGTGQKRASGNGVRCVVVDESAIVPPTPNAGGGNQPQPGTSAIDLSASATANCYIVSEAGDYMFKAVKGNGTDAVGEVAKAELLWESDNTTTAPELNSIIATVGVEEGYITFSTPATLKAGNALIAALDANDVVLWSWHIWIPATEVVIQDGTALCGANIMDRNLGALVATAATGDVDARSIGFSYQWGRKDPFPGPAEFASSPAGAALAGTEWKIKTELITTEYSIQHPIEYAHVPEVDSGVWNSDDPKDLWNTSENGKTIYDPCPPGYRVPKYDSSLPMWKGSFDENWTVDAGSPADHRFAYGEIVFPIAGYIDCWGGSYAYSDSRTHVWAASWYDATRSNCMYYRGSRDPGARYESQKYHKAKAGSVRCVAE